MESNYSRCWGWIIESENKLRWVYMREFNNPVEILAVTDEEWTEYMGSFVDYFNPDSILVRSKIVKYTATPYSNDSQHTYTGFIDENGVQHSLTRIKRIL